jgi:predicted amidohydrolase
MASPRFESKILHPGRIDSWAAGLPRPLVFTNGVFDILHRGHVTYLAQARELGAAVTGSIAVEVDGKRYNRLLFVTPEGTVHSYDKRHLFRMLGEDLRYAAGTGKLIVDYRGWRILPLVCYDMRFPDLFSAYAKSGVDMITLPSAFTVPTGEAHWHTLLRARAIESAAFIIAAAQCDVHEDGRQTYGHSLVVDPWGTILLDMGISPGLACVDLDLDTIKRVRKQIPVHANRRIIPSPFIA